MKSGGRGNEISKNTYGRGPLRDYVWFMVACEGNLSKAKYGRMAMR